MQPEFAAKKKTRVKDSASAVAKNDVKETAPGVPHFLKSARNSAAPGTENGYGAASEKPESPGPKPNIAPEHYEHDADRLAEQSLNQGSASGMSQATQTNAHEKLASVASTSGVIPSSGDPLPGADRLHFENSMNADFRDVRVHHDDAAARAAENLNALAFTENRDIAFGPGQYQPGTAAGQRLLAHELAHVKQQSSGEVTGVQREPKPDTQTAPAPPAPAPAPERPTNELFAREDVEDMRARATARYFQTSMTVSTGVQTIGKIKDALMEVNGRYSEAYQNYSAAVTAGGKEARNQQEWIDFFIGLGVGISLGLGSEFLLPVTASRALELSVEVGTELAEGVTGMGVKATGWTTVVGQDLAPARGLDPMVMELDIYKLLENLHRGVFDVARFCDAQFLINDAAEYAIGEIKAHVAGGEQEMSELDLLDLIDTIAAADQAGTSLDKDLASFAGKLNDIKSRVESAPRQTVREMEQDIWILWMSTIKDADSDIIDIDAIEDRLLSVGVIGASGRLKVDFGYYTSKDDELTALKLAREEAPVIYRRLDELTSAR